MYDFHKQVSKFHGDHVRLSHDQQSEMRDKRASNLKRIQDGLEANGKPAFVEEIKQGGYKHKTMVQPPEAEPELQYDIDNAIVFDEADADVTPRTARERVRAAIVKKGSGLTALPVSKSKCVRVSYADGKQCDFPVLRRCERLFSDKYTYELAAGDEWLTRDSTEISDWVDERVATLSPDEAGSYQLRRIIRLFKFFGKSHAFANRHSFPSGIIMTALVIDHYVAQAKRDDLSFRETLRAIVNYADTPVYAGEECVSDERDEARIARLCAQGEKSLVELDKLDGSDVTEKQANAAWKKVFRHSFFAVDQMSKASLGISVSTAKTAGALGEQRSRLDRHAETRRNSKGSIPPYGRAAGKTGKK